MTLPAPLTNQFNLMTNAGTVTLDHTLTKHHSVTGSYSYVRVRPFDGNGSAGSSYPAVQTLNAGYLYTVNPGLLLRATGGVVRGPEFAYTAGGAVEKQLGGLWLMAGFQRYLSFLGGFAPGVGTANGAIPFADGLLPNSVFEAASLRVRGNLTKRVGLDFNGQMGRASVVGRGVRSLIGQARVDYKLNDRLTVFARAEYYGQNVSEFSSFPLSRSRYFGGLEIVLSRPPETDVASRRRQQIPRCGCRAPGRGASGSGGEITNGSERSGERLLRICRSSGPEAPQAIRAGPSAADDWSGLRLHAADAGTVSRPDVDRR